MKRINALSDGKSILIKSLRVKIQGEKRVGLFEIVQAIVRGLPALLSPGNLYYY